MIFSATAKEQQPLSKLDLVHQLFDEFADTRAEGVFRIQPDTKFVTQLESELENLANLSEKKRIRAIATLHEHSPELFDTYVLANVLMRCYQQSALFPIIDESIDYKALAAWHLFLQKLSNIQKLCENNDQSLIDKATNQAFLIFMGEMLAQGHHQNVQSIHRLLCLCKLVSKQADENKMSLAAIAHQFPACFSGMFFLDSMICKENKVAEWKFISNMLLGILSANDFSLPCDELYQQKESDTSIDEQSSKLKTVLMTMPALSEWIVSGTPSNKLKACQFLFSPTVKHLLPSRTNSKESTTSLPLVPMLDLTVLGETENLPPRENTLLQLAPRGIHRTTTSSPSPFPVKDDSSEEKIKPKKR